MPLHFNGNFGGLISPVREGANFFIFTGGESDNTAVLEVNSGRPIVTNGTLRRGSSYISLGSTSLFSS